MTLELPDIVIATLIEALNDGSLIQKQARLCDLAALDFIPTAILPHLKLHHQKAIALSPLSSQKIRKKLSRLIRANDPSFRNPSDPEGFRKLAQSKNSIASRGKPERCLPEQNSLNRVLAGMHPARSQQQINNLFNSENWLDRLSVACNPQLKREYLLQSSQDENNVVRQTAKELLK